MTPRHDHHEDDHDRGLLYDVRTMSRRRALFFLGAMSAGTAMVGAGCAATDSANTATESSPTGTTQTTTATSVAEAAPQETNGPYPADGTNGPNVLIESGVVRSDITTSFGGASGTAPGTPMTLTMTMQDLAQGGAAGAGMAVYLWQCDAEGRYSLYSDGVTDENFLRGVQVAGADGTLTFSTVFPGCYPGRWPHFHFEVFDSLEAAVAGSDARLTSQIALSEDASRLVYEDAAYAGSVANLDQLTLDTDSVFGDGWSAELATVTGAPSVGMAATITVGVAEKSLNVDNSGPPPGAPGPPPGPRP